MKKTLVLSTFIFILFFQQAFAHKEWVHQYLVWEAYSFLAQEKNYTYADLRDHMGFGFNGYDSHADPWRSGFVGVGAWNEDESDPIFHLGFLGQGWSPTATHFWLADAGDDYYTPVSSSTPAPNAWIKARKYLFGGQDIFFQHSQTQTTVPGYQPFISKGDLYKYPSLKDFWINGDVIYSGYMASNNEVVYFSTPVTRHVDFELRKKYCYGILGRVAHLLADQGVPAHAHANEHVCGSILWWLNNPDYYELFMGGNWETPFHEVGCDDPQIDFPAKLWNKTTAHYQGSLIDIAGLTDEQAMRKLFYTQNQIADFFPSNNFPGNTVRESGNSQLEAIYGSYGNNPPTSANVMQIANASFNYTIRATATLLDWFAQKTLQPELTFPVINSINFNLPGYNVFRNETGTLTCYPYDPTWHYDWSAEPCGDAQCHPPVTGLSMTQTGSNWLKIQNTNYQQLTCQECNSLDNTYPPLYYKIKVTATNQWGTSAPFYLNVPNVAGISPIGANRPPYGCPFVYVQNDSGQFISDNNILHKSEFTENAGFDISDKYLLNVKPGVFDNKINMSLFESTHDISSINSIKLLAVDHPIGTKIGVTENNDIIMYFDEDVESPKNADRNHIENITQYVQYNNPRDNDTVSGIPTDDIYNNFDEEIIGGRIQSSRNKFNRLGRNLNRGTGDSVALIMRVGLNENVDRPVGITPPAKRPAGNVTLTSDGNSMVTQFARRESPSLIIIPFGTNTSIEKADINWERDFSMSFAAVIDVFYSGFDVTELPLSAALNSANYDLLEDLQNVDGYYATLDTSGIIMLQFDNVENTSGMLRDYVLVTDGQYAAGTPGQRPASMPKGLTKNAPDNVLGFTNKLNANFPNPFNPTTKINYQIKKDGFVSLKIYNVVGQLVKELVGEFKNAGNYIVEFNGSHLASGTYYYRIEANDFVETKKMILIK